MARAVNPPPRRYDNSGRRERAAATRAAVVAAARAAFLERGYAGASIAAIADDAGVSPELVYKTIGPKPAVLKAVLDTSIVGDVEPVALQQRPDVQRLKAMTSAPPVLHGYAEMAVGVLQRLAPVYLLARDAAAVDPAARGVLDEMNDERLSGMTAMAGQLTSLGGMRPGLSRTEVRDILWTYGSPELYERLVLARGWSARRYVRFLQDALTAALLA